MRERGSYADLQSGVRVFRISCWLIGTSVFESLWKLNGSKRVTTWMAQWRKADLGLTYAMREKMHLLSCFKSLHSHAKEN